MCRPAPPAVSCLNQAHHLADSLMITRLSGFEEIEKSSLLASLILGEHELYWTILGHSRVGLLVWCNLSTP